MHIYSKEKPALSSHQLRQAGLPARIFNHIVKEKSNKKPATTPLER